ncbi:MAG: AMP-binding protein [Myxococcota bacterium]|nr:AMP-binding protein [Myxococcota bacterium]
MPPPSLDQLTSLGLPEGTAQALRDCFAPEAEAEAGGQATWRALRSLLRPEHPFEAHQLLFSAAYARRPDEMGPAPAWSPSEEEIAASNLGPALAESDLETLHHQSVSDPESWWGNVLQQLGIHFRTEPEGIIESGEGPSQAQWLPGARLNIIESCFHGRDPQALALIWAGEDGELQTLSLAELRRRSNEVAWGLQAAGMLPGDAVAACMPMTVDSVAIYLGTILAGCVVVSIADSFAPEEIATRLRISNARAVFTQDFIQRGERQLPLYQRVADAEAPRAIVLPVGERVNLPLRDGDFTWEGFRAQGATEDHFEPCVLPADTATNILFSSGTTGEPKAIPWTHITPIKAAADGWGHHDIRTGDVVAWPTNLGWMMGPWLIYASLLNGATIALFDGIPTGRPFCKFVQDAGVTMLGLVPSLAKAWRASKATDGLDWSRVRCFSSTGEASNAEDYLWLMSRVPGYRPVVEYCGGTEIGGGYICGSFVQAQAPATFSTPALGCAFVLIDEDGEATDLGELALVPPLLGSSNRLLNKDHQTVYFEGMPKGPSGQVLRRHGDQMERLPQGYYRAHGRVDDTMNLGGIKVSSAEIERVCNAAEAILETAAIAVPRSGGGPSRLVIHAVLKNPDSNPSLEQLRGECQLLIREGLNPLFKVDELVIEDALPRTASGKVMRRVLRRRTPTLRDA